MRKPLIIALAIASFLTGWFADRPFQRNRKSAPEALPLVQTASQSERKKVVYPYSVVPGGVASEAEIQVAMLHDRQVAEHYREVNVATLVPVVLRSHTEAYVSFRKYGRIYWTSHKIKLAKGERLFSNGTDCIRGRCGNRVSWTPRQPVLPEKLVEPTSAELNTPHGDSHETRELALGPATPDSPSPNPVASTGAPAAVAGGRTAGGSAGGAGGGAPSAGGGTDSGIGVVTSQPFGGVPAVILPPSMGPAVPPTSVPAAGPLFTTISFPAALTPGAANPSISLIPGFVPPGIVKIGTPAYPTHLTVVPAPSNPSVTPDLPQSPGTPHTPDVPGTPSAPSTPATPDVPGTPGHPTVEDTRVPNAEVPEPSTLWLVGAGLAVAAVISRKWRRAVPPG